MFALEVIFLNEEGGIESIDQGNFILSSMENKLP